MTASEMAAASLKQPANQKENHVNGGSMKKQASNNLTAWNQQAKPAATAIAWRQKQRNENSDERKISISGIEEEGENRNTGERKRNEKTGEISIK